ncbi:MAG: hypothetical protein COA78_34665 [Blastopirellula sp.]|nr:MAG: hypothetical protein COA78_34665 [Blastopirellula sp.]
MNIDDLFRCLLAFIVNYFFAAFLSDRFALATAWHGTWQMLVLLAETCLFLVIVVHGLVLMATGKKPWV